MDQTLNWQVHTAKPQINFHLSQRSVQTTNTMVKRRPDERTNRKLATGNMRETFIL